MIIDYFSGIPRAEQVDILNQIEDNWSKFSCHVVQAPVATGKSRIAVAIAKWAESWEARATICPPNGVLQSQYEDSFKDLASLRGAAFYDCPAHRYPKRSCQQVRAKKLTCGLTCSHAAATAAARASYTRLMNTYTLLGTRKTLGYPQVLILDEAHKVVEFLQDQVGVKFWQCKDKWPSGLQTKADVLAWLESGKLTAARAKARSLILSDPDGVLVEKRLEPYFNRDEWCLRVVPLSPRSAKPVLWPRPVKKLVLLSATIGPKDIEDCGIDRFFDVHYVKSGSPIPPSLRPVEYLPLVTMTHEAKPVEMPKLAGYLETLASYHPGAGLVHVTYEDAEALRPLLTGPRWLWHTKSNKSQIYTQWARGAAGRGRVLVGSGFTEGVDLAGDAATWQVVAKVPTLSLADSSVAARAERDPEWYAWQSVKQLIQASGRVCRSPTDYGVTYVLDRQFERLFRERRYLFPNWYADSVRGID